MEKIVNLEKRGLVLTFDDFVNEKLEVSIRPDKIIIAPNKECFDAVWSILEQQCGGDAEVLKDYLEQEYDIEATANFKWGVQAHVSGKDEDFTAAVNKMMDVLDNKVKKEKDKVQEKK